MSNEIMTLYKMIVLQMLDRAGRPLSGALISEFMTEKEYTDFLTLQGVLSELKESGLVSSEQAQNRTFYSITQEGAQTLEFFGERLSKEVREDVKEYLVAHEIRIVDEMSVKTDYKAQKGTYVVELTALDGASELAHIRLNVPTERMAEQICNHFKERNEEIYHYLVSRLF